jgi:hypothetical protein
MNEKGKGVGFGQMAALIKDASEKHEAPLANVRVKKITDQA